VVLANPVDLFESSSVRPARSKPGFVPHVVVSIAALWATKRLSQFQSNARRATALCRRDVRRRRVALRGRTRDPAWSSPTACCSCTRRWRAAPIRGCRPDRIQIGKPPASMKGGQIAVLSDGLGAEKVHDLQCADGSGQQLRPRLRVVNVAGAAAQQARRRSWRSLPRSAATPSPSLPEGRSHSLASGR
jgi:hypothetical protein